MSVEDRVKAYSIIDPTKINPFRAVESLRYSLKEQKELHHDMSNLNVDAKVEDTVKKIVKGAYDGDWQHASAHEVLHLAAKAGKYLSYDACSEMGSLAEELNPLEDDIDCSNTREILSKFYDICKREIPARVKISMREDEKILPLFERCTGELQELMNESGMSRCEAVFYDFWSDEKFRKTFKSYFEAASVSAKEDNRYDDPLKNIMFWKLFGKGLKGVFTEIKSSGVLIRNEYPAYISLDLILKDCSLASVLFEGDEPKRREDKYPYSLHELFRISESKAALIMGAVENGYSMEYLKGELTEGAEKAVVGVHNSSKPVWYNPLTWFC